MVPLDLLLGLRGPLVDERFTRIPPAGIPEWTALYDRALDERPGWVEEWLLGRAALNDLVEPRAAELSMARADISRHLRVVRSDIGGSPRYVAGSSD